MQWTEPQRITLLPPNIMRLVASNFSPMQILRLSQSSRNIRNQLTTAKEGHIMLVEAIVNYLDLPIPKQIYPTLDVREMLVLFIQSICI